MSVLHYSAILAKSNANIFRHAKQLPNTQPTNPRNEEIRSHHCIPANACLTSRPIKGLLRKKYKLSLWPNKPPALLRPFFLNANTI